MSIVKRGIVHRYTSLSSALHILRNKQLTLLSPDSWSDPNDRCFMEEYRKAKGKKQVFALCFTLADETLHHWKAFADGPEGVRIEFQHQALMAKVRQDPALRYGKVKYVQWHTLSQKLSAARSAFDALPFIKRYSYRDEKEFRLVSLSDDDNPMGIEIDISMVRRVMLSPWLKSALKATVTDTIRAIPGCEKLQVSRSGLLENKGWTIVAKNLAPNK